jgi:hypothetical protein
MSSGFQPLYVGSEFNDPMDVYVNAQGEHAYLQLMIPMARTFFRDGVEVSQSLHHPMPRFRRGEEHDQIYFALYMPFSKSGGLMDSRITSLMTIDEPVIAGPYMLGLDGPALLLPLLDDDENVLDEDEMPDSA